MVKQIRSPTGNALWDHTFEKIRKDGVRHAQNMRDKAKNAKKVDFPIKEMKLINARAIHEIAKYKFS